MKMEEWKEYQLGDVCSRLSSGKNISVSKISGSDVYPVFGGNGLRGYTDNSNFTGECAIIGRQGAFCGNVRFFSGEAYMTEHAVVVCGNEKANTRYLSYLLSTMNLGRLSGQSAQPGLAVGTLAKQLIKLPPLPTQQKIDAILSSLDDKIELNNKINTNLEQQAQALFKSWFVDFEPFGGKMPEEWKVGKLSDIADYYNGYAFSSKELLNEPGENCLDVFKQGHIKKGGGFIPDGTKSWYPLSKCEKLKNYILKKGDILMAMTDMKGNVAILGNTAIMPVDDKYIVNQRVGLLRAKRDLNIAYPYLYLLTNDHDFLMDLRSRANSGVQVNLSSTAIKESEVNIAPKEVYKQFNNIVLPLFENILANQQENQKLAIIRDTLLPKLMNGEIEV